MRDFDSGGRDEYADHGSDPGDTAEHWSDPGDTGTPEWWGLFTGDGFSVTLPTSMEQASALPFQSEEMGVCPGWRGGTRP